MKIFRIIIISIIIFLVINTGKTYGQRNKVKNLPKYDLARYHFGFILAANQMFFTVKTKPGFSDITFDQSQSPDIFADSSKLYQVNSDPTLGFTIGIVSNMRLGKYFDLRFIPSLTFGERYMNYSIMRYKDGKPTLVDIQKNITSTYVDLPIHIKFKSKRINNMRAYVLGGIKYNIDLAANKKKKDDTDETYLKLKKNDFLFEIGVGFDFYTGFFKFGTELKMSYGIVDLLQRENNIYTDCIESLNSKIFQLSFTFE
ncbi:MAG: PorT family protein [Bacteroidales bacterium]|nr:PorT family protein [Bacteroidales bacterium]